MILFLNKMDDYWKNRINEIRDDFPDTEFLIPQSKEERIKYMKKSDGIVTSRFQKEDIEKSKNLKVLFIPYTGVNFFPVDKLKEQKIIISNAHGNSQYVAERALALSLSLMGRIVEYHNDLREGYWHRGEGEAGRWESLYEKTLGILGTGKIGLKLAKLLKPFSDKIIGFRKHADRPLLPNFKRITDNIFEVVKESDVIYITLPLTDETMGLINLEVLKKMRDKYLINVGRGNIIEEEALYRSLKKGILKGAGLDVWYSYPDVKNQPFFPSNYPLFKLDNVVITPHNAGNANLARKKNVNETFRNIRSYLETGEPENIVDPDLQY